jgi:hypothetical protein
MGFKLLAKMLGLIILFIIVAGIASLSLGKNSYYIGLLLPVLLFGFLIYKFKKNGIISIIYFLGGAFLLYGFFLLNFIGIIIGLIFLGIGFFLSKIWKIDIFKKKTSKD